MDFKVLIILLFITSISFSQDFTGNWKGKIQMKDSTVHIEFYLTHTNNEVMGIMSKPELSIFSDSIYNGGVLRLVSRNRAFSYKGTMASNLNELSGEFTMNNKIYQLKVNRGDKPLYRPQ